MLQFHGRFSLASRDRTHRICHCRFLDCKIRVPPRRRLAPNSDESRRFRAKLHFQLTPNSQAFLLCHSLPFTSSQSFHLPTPSAPLSSASVVSSYQTLLHPSARSETNINTPRVNTTTNIAMHGLFVVAALCASLSAAQDLSAIQGLPDCGVRSIASE